ncbi:hypothetical protein ACHQM5_000603 [Ranunculus cassubicifolius]
MEVISWTTPWDTYQSELKMRRKCLEAGDISEFEIPVRAFDDMLMMHNFCHGFGLVESWSTTGSIKYYITNTIKDIIEFVGVCTSNALRNGVFV